MTTDELLLRILGETTTINTQLSAMSQRVMHLQFNVVALVAMMILLFGVWWWFND